MKSPKIPNLYSRLALITSVTLITGYLIVSAVWVPMNNVGTGDQLTATIWNTFVGNLNDLDTRLKSTASTWPTVTGGIAYTGGYVGIGTTNPGAYRTAIRGSDDTSANGALWVSGQVAGTPGLMVRNDGNVGIGTATPYRLLSLKGSVPVLRFEDIDAAGAVGEINVNNNFGSIIIDSDASNTTAGSFTSFQVDGTEKMRIDGVGNVGIGAIPTGTKLKVTQTTDSQWTSHIEGASPTTGQNYGLTVRAGTTSADISFNVMDKTSTNYYLHVRGDGNVGIGTGAPAYKLQLSNDSAAKPTSNTWIIASDKRIKKDIDNFTDGLDTILALQPRTYKYNGLGGVGYDDTETHIGIVAQEVEKVAPYMVETRTGTIDGKEVNDFKTYQGHALPFILVNAVQDLKKENDELKKRIERLEKR